MKKYRKIWAVLLTLAMVLGMSMTTMAADVHVPSADDKADITVEKVEAGATVTAYQIIKAVYDDNDKGFVGYEWLIGDNANKKVEFDSEGNVEGLTSDVIINYANSLTESTIPSGNAIAGTDKTATLTDLPVGTYMILVAPSRPGVTYNPMIASVNYNTQKSGSDNTAEDGSVSANTNWVAENAVVYAKSSALTLTKTVDDDTKEAAEGRSNDGEKVTFTVTTTIPSYSNAYGENLTFGITDSRNRGLKYDNAKPEVKVGNIVLTENKEYTLTFNTERSLFTINFDKDYLRGLAGKADTERSVEITYGAYATADATVAQPGKNEVTLYYSDTPNTTKQLTAFENVYTFDITGAIKKVKEDETPLPGATFTLYKNEDLTDVFATCTTNDEGTIAFSGLGAVEGTQAGTGTYYLKETAAPNGYTINDTVYRVEIKNIQRVGTTDDTIKSYDVVVTNMADTTKTTTTTITVGNNTPTGTTMSIVNTKISALPSTGGIGTTIFTIGGCAIMIAAAFLFFASRKKNENR